MEDLKIFVDMVAKLPSMALWVIALFWAYKVVVIGSVYALIRFVVDRLHSWLTFPKLSDARVAIDGEVVSGAMSELISQLRRIKGKSSGSELYVHKSDVDWLRIAIDEKSARDCFEARKG